MSEESASKSDDVSSLPAISPQQNDLMKQATAEFEKKNYGACVNHMNKLASQRSIDPKVLHNKSVAEFYHSGSKTKDDLQKNLQTVCKMSKRMSSDNDSLEDVDQAVVFYNQAVILFHLQQYRSALELMDKIIPVLEPLVSLYPTEENLARKCVLLLIELYLNTSQPEKALGRVMYFERTYLSKSGDKAEKPDQSIEALRNKLNLYKSKCLLMLKSLKAGKREIKALMSLQPNHPLTLVYLKCHLDYLKGSYKKSLKSLSSVPPSKDITELGDCLTMMYYNNLGCLHFHLRKHHLGAFHFRKAVLENEKAVKDTRYGDKDRPLNMVAISRHYELLYNMGIQLLHCGQSQAAFDCLVQAVQVYQTNPRLWLRLAECCIQFNKENNDDDRKLERRLEVIQNSVGMGIHRKLILGPGLKKADTGNGSILSPSPTYQFAAHCLQNALHLLPPTQSQSTESGSTQLTDNVLVPAPPGNPMKPSEVSNLRCSVLCSAAFVSLCLNDHLMALTHAKNLLNQPSITGAQRYLGNLYMAEALVVLDRISDAVHHLQPEILIDISTSIPKDKEETTDSDPDEQVQEYGPLYSWSPKELTQAKGIMHYNLAATYAIRGDFNKANANLSESGTFIGSPKPSQMFFLKLYLDLMEGKREMAQIVIKDHFGHMTPNRVDMKEMAKEQSVKAHK